MAISLRVYWLWRMCTGPYELDAGSICISPRRKRQIFNVPTFMVLGGSSSAFSWEDRWLDV
jgi:hypothetical protein